ncbi:MAG TPA: hypothetical protein VEW71_06285 [Allosphingosinicella sp.]|nr:hypothetical protein [Allosphingosinicella sp.]
MSGLFNLIQFNLVTLGVALLIGVAAARWIFRRPPAPEPGSEDATQT